MDEMKDLLGEWPISFTGRCQFHLQVDVSWKFSTFFVVTYQPWLEDIKEIIEGRVRVQGANSVFSAVSRISSRWSSSIEKLLQKASFEDFKRCDDNKKSEEIEAKEDISLKRNVKPLPLWLFLLDDLKYFMSD